MSYTLDIFEKISLFTQVSDVLVALFIGYQDGTKTTVNPMDLDKDSSRFYPYHPGIQAGIDISKYVEDTSLQQILFWFKKSINHSIVIELDDKRWDTVHSETSLQEKDEAERNQNYFGKSRNQCC